MDKIFIEQAKHIRREYIKNAREVIKCESKIENFRKDLSLLQEELNEDMKEDIIKEKLVLIEKNIKFIENIIEPHVNKINQLEKDAEKLFEKIKEKYPNREVSDIQNDLIPHLAEIKF